jgi:hypothetical protein
MDIIGEMQEFANKVAAMRQCQRDYFRARDRKILLRAKSLEKEVDALLERYSNGINSPKLF